MSTIVSQHVETINEPVTFTEQRSNPCPEETANIFSRLTFWWLNGLMSTGYNKVLQSSDLFDLRKDEASYLVSENFQSNLASEVTKGNSLLYALHKTFGLRFYLAGFLKVVYDVTQLVSPLFIKWIVASIQAEEDSSMYWGYFLIGGLFLIQIFGAILIQQYFFIVMSQGMRIKTGLRTAIYRKTLKISRAIKQNISSGDIFNYMSSDANKLGGLVKNLHMSWSSLFQIVASVIMLFLLVGWSSLVGLSILFVTIPVNGVVARFVQRMRKIVLRISGERIKLVNEAMHGIRIIKLYAWESSFLKKIMDIRDKEIWKITQTTLIGIFTNTLMISSPLFVGIVTFTVYAATENALEPKIIFPALSYFALIKSPASFLPSILAQIAESRVSLQRIQSYLLSEEVEETLMGSNYGYPIIVTDGQFVWNKLTETPRESATILNQENCEPNSLTSQEKEEDQIMLRTPKDKDLSVTIGDEEHPVEEPTEEKTEFSLQSINIKVKRGDLLVVCGSVASGKSSLLSALIGEMHRIGGDLEISGTVAYVPQQAWIMNATVKENILFGNPFCQSKYQQTLSSCCLEHDLETLHAGDLTEIGEKGNNLSGGQKQRVNLARSVYCDADIYLFDDVLSALDQQVSRSVFDNCICGILSKKTRILVTNQWQYLQNADSIVYIQEGEIIAQGSLSQLMEKNDSRFSPLFREYVTSHHTNSERENIITQSQNEETKEKVKKDGKLICKEERAEGSVKLSVYKSYIQYSGGYLNLIVILFLFAMSQTAQILTNWFLATWSKVATDSKKSAHDYNLAMYIGIYVSFGVASALLVLVQETIFGLTGLRASKRLHNTALQKIMAAPIQFFDTNPVGRIINRFSSDTESIDTQVITTVKQLLVCLYSLSGTLVVIITVNFWALIPIVPVLIVYAMAQNYYRRTNRELKRLNSITRSPLLSHFGETLTGMATVRAFRRQKDFISQNEKLIDDNNKAFFAQLAAERWIAFRLKLVSVFIIFFTSLTLVITHSPSALAGLSLTYALSVSSGAEWLVRFSSEAEASMNSVERVLHYCENIPQEASNETTELKTKDWPQQGEIELKSIFLKYRDDLDYVLKDLSMKIFPNEKIGIIGRTGSGKSTLMSCLFRMTELSQGQILIDGVDISKMDLHDLRSKLSIIPQDPTMFSGSLRFNLDPFDQYEDYQIWQALERSHIKERVQNLNGQLEAKVTEYGENFSLGERQLFCLARAILRKSKIIIMDEATASVDMETDALIQQTVNSEFSNCTVLTVAHRLNTIIDSDRVLALKCGELAEFDTPRSLLTSPSIFSELIEETGSTNASFLRSLVMNETETQ